MSGRKPTLGFPSRTDAVVALRGKHLSTKEIADRIGIRQSTVVALELSASRSRRREQSCRTVLFPIDLLVQLSKHAARRGCSINELARRIVDTVVDENIVDAVLDDAEDVARYLGEAS